MLIARHFHQLNERAQKSLRFAGVAGCVRLFQQPVKDSFMCGKFLSFICQKSAFSDDRLIPQTRDMKKYLRIVTHTESLSARVGHCHPYYHFFSVTDQHLRGIDASKSYSTVTDFARLRG